MRLFSHILAKAFAQNNRKRVSSLLSDATASSRAFSQLHSHSHSQQPSFGIAFDIDGVILRGDLPIGGSPQALKRLYNESGGGVPESKRAHELSKQFSLDVLPLQVIQGHTPFKNLVNRFEKEFIIAVGKGEPAVVMSEYGFKNVLSIDEYASCFDNIDALAPHKEWKTGQVVNQMSDSFRQNICSQRVKAAFVVSDSVDWSRDIQVLCDILRTGGLPGGEIANQPHIYFANDDLGYQALFPSERLGMGSFRIALEAVFNRIHPVALEYTTFGKPNPFVFKNAEIVLMELMQSSYHKMRHKSKQYKGDNPFKTLYMIGDNPSVDIKGARQAGPSWFSILTRTGVFKGEENDAKHPADLVVGTVEEAVDFVLRRECFS